MQSIFRYPGGKTRTRVQEWILGHRPAGVREYREPFVGGGGIFFGLDPGSVASRWINDAHPGLVEVYRALVERPADFIARCRAVEPARPDDPLTPPGVEDGKPQNARLKAVFDSVCLNETCDQAFRYFFVNRCVFGGRVNNDRPSRLYFSKPEGWDVVKGDRLERAARWVAGAHVTCGDFAPLFDAPGEGVWVYADPPYVRDTGSTGNSKLYQHSFTPDDHRRLAGVVRRCRHKVALSYDDDPDGLVRSLYPEAAGFRIVEGEWAYNGSTLATKDRGKELLILNYEPPSLFAGMAEPLSASEAEELTRYEEVIGRGLQAYAETGRALRAVRDGRLYREAFTTFEGYCRERWGMSRPRAYQLIEAAAVVEAIPVSTNCRQTALRESQARELASLRTPEGAIDPGKVAEVWGRVVEKARAGGEGGVRITARMVREEVAAVMPPRSHMAPTGPAKGGARRPVLESLLSLDDRALRRVLAELVEVLGRERPGLWESVLGGVEEVSRV